MRCNMRSWLPWSVLASLLVCLSSLAAGPAARPILTLKGHAATIYSIAFSPDGRLLASASNGHNFKRTDSEIKIWDLKTKREVRSLHGHKYGTWKIAFSPD